MKENNQTNNKIFTLKELEETIKLLKKKKTPEDSINNELFIFANTSLKIEILDLFNYNFVNSITPEIIQNTHSIQKRRQTTNQKLQTPITYEYITKILRKNIGQKTKITNK